MTDLYDHRKYHIRIILGALKNPVLRPYGSKLNQLSQGRGDGVGGDVQG